MNGGGGMKNERAIGTTRLEDAKVMRARPRCHLDSRETNGYPLWIRLMANNYKRSQSERMGSEMRARRKRTTRRDAKSRIAGEYIHCLEFSHHFVSVENW